MRKILIFLSLSVLLLLLLLLLCHVGGGNCVSILTKELKSCGKGRCLDHHQI